MPLPSWATSAWCVTLGRIPSASLNWSGLWELNPSRLRWQRLPAPRCNPHVWLLRVESNHTSPSYQLGALSRATKQNLVRVAGAAPAASEFQARPSAVDLHPEFGGVTW